MCRANMLLPSIVLGACVALALHAAPLLAQPSGAIPGVIAAGTQPELVKEGFVFTEGPLGTKDGGLYFNDNRESKTYLLDRGGKISVAYEQTKAANGLALTRQGDLLAAEGEGKRISRRSRDGKLTPVSESYKGMPHLSPNDLIADARGGVYFTDPGPRPVVPGRPTHVLYLPAGASTADPHRRRGGASKRGHPQSGRADADRRQHAGAASLRLRRPARRFGEEQARLRRAARHSRGPGERRRRHGGRPRRAALCVPA